jgi:probable F420-dependent oxidoreductase
MPETSAMPVRPFRFGVQASSAGTRTDWMELARRVEANGYSTLGMPDHLDGQLSPVPALQCAADATSTLRLGALVFDNDFRHPVVLAKELATMDVLSNGRVQLGIGAGWTATDYQQSGIPYDPPGVRISRMIEAVSIIRSAFEPERFSFTGEHYTVTDYNGMPKPLQARLPLLIGGGGPRVLGYAAREADIVGINPTLTSGAIDESTFDSMTAEEVDSKVAVVREAAAVAGRLDAIEMNVRAFMVTVTDDPDSAIQAIADFTRASAEMISQSPFALVGPPNKLAEDLLARRDRWGFSYVIVGQNDVEAFAPVVARLAGT